LNNTTGEINKRRPLLSRLHARGRGEKKGEKRKKKKKRLPKIKIRGSQLIAVLTFWHFDVLTAGTLAYLAHFVARICLTNCSRPLQKKKTKKREKKKKKEIEGTNCYEACINKNCAGVSKLLRHAG